MNMQDAIKWEYDGRLHVASLGPIAYNVTKITDDARRDVEKCLLERTQILMDGPDDAIYKLSSGLICSGKDMKREILAAIA